VFSFKGNATINQGEGVTSVAGAVLANFISQINALQCEANQVKEWISVQVGHHDNVGPTIIWNGKSRGGTFFLTAQPAWAAHTITQ